MADITKKDILNSAWTKLAVSSGAAAQTIDVTSEAHIVLYARNTDANAATITVSASTSRGMITSGMGDLSVALAQNEEAMVVLDYSRFRNATDDDIDFVITDADGSSFSGTVADVKVQALVFRPLR